MQRTDGLPQLNLYSLPGAERATTRTWTSRQRG